MRLFFALHTFLIAAFSTQLRRCYSGVNPPQHCISKLTLSKLSNSYHVKNDIINYGRFKYVYTIKNHPIQDVTTRILDHLKRESSFWLVYSKCPLYPRKSCFDDILIKNTNDTTSARNNFYFSDSLLYIPQATSLFPHVCHLLRGEHRGRHVPHGEGSVGEAAGEGDEKTVEESKQTADGSEQTREEPPHGAPPPPGRGTENFVIISNVFRKDNIDKLHFPFFNQMDVYIKIKNELLRGEKQLLCFLCSLMDSLFSKTHKWRVRRDSFDFTNHSLQAEVYHNDKWVEILGCGILKKKILFRKWKQYDVGDYIAVGLGLDRIAMIKWQVTRIRDLYLYITNTGGNTVYTKKTNTGGGGEKATVANVIRHDDMPGGETNGDASGQTEGPFVREEPSGDENILVGSPKLEGTHLRNALLNGLARKRDLNRPESDSFLYFLNLYNIRHEERDVSFYVKPDWDTELFTKRVLHFASLLGGSPLLRRVLLLDVFFHGGSGRTSYTYKFLYDAPATVQEQHTFRGLVNELHARLVREIVRTHDVIIR
ncbi:phenylalanine--tRNA ligase, putative [Plasmodium vivax]|nr:phenylalanine--tRNA ligase, putative [Plasmodium vivax]